MAYTTMSIRIDKDDYDFVKKLAIKGNVMTILTPDGSVGFITLS